MNLTSSAEHAQFVRELAKGMGLDIAVYGQGKYNAKIAIVGEYPGTREVETGIPFSGGSGQILWRALQTLGIRRADVYCTNVIKRRVIPDESKKKLPGHEEQYWWDLVIRELDVMPNLEYILVLGNRALEVVTGEHGINNWHGSVLNVGEPRFKIPKRVVCANNPAAVLRDVTQEVVFQFDVAKLKRVIDGKFTPYEIVYHYNPSYTDATEWLDYLRGQVDAGIPLAYDIESISNETACIGFAPEGHEGFCINFRNHSDNLFTAREEVILRRQINELVRADNVKLVGQNCNFDAYFLGYKDRIMVRKNWFDTLLAHHTLYPTLPHGLGFLVAQYTDHPFYKDEGSAWKEGGDIDTFWKYNIKDACLTWECHRMLLAELKQQKLDTFFFTHVMRLQPHLTPITITGLRIDHTHKDELAAELEETLASKRDEFRSIVQTLTGDPEYDPNPASPAQMKELYFDRLRLIGRGISTDKDNRYRMRTHPTTTTEAQKMLQLVDEIAEDAKFLGTYANMRVDEDGRARTEFKQFGTKSAPGRLSSGKPIWGTGANFQNQPERAQSMYIADDGCEFGYFDLSQAEARFVGWDAELEDWIADFERARVDSSYDCHRALAATMFDTPYDEVPSYDRDESGNITIRFIAKRCRHGLNYRMGPDRLATTTKLPLSVATEHYNTYHRVNPGLRKWWHSLEREFRDNRCLYNAYGRRLLHLGRMDEDALKSIVAFKPQSSIGDKVNRTIYLSQEHPRWPVGKARIMLNIHDALIVMSDRRYTKTCLSIMKKYAEEPMLIKGRELIIPADTKISVADEQGMHRWSNLKTAEIEAIAA